jgi:hypothetical protein
MFITGVSHAYVCKRVKFKVVPVFATKAYRGSGCITPLILNLSAGWRWVVNLRSQLLFPWERTLVPIESVAGWYHRSLEILPSHHTHYSVLVHILLYLLVWVFVFIVLVCIPLEKVVVPKLVRQARTFGGTQRSVTGCYLSLSWVRSIQSTPSYTISWRSILLPSVPRSSMCIPSFRFPHQSSYVIFLLEVLIWINL